MQKRDRKVLNMLLYNAMLPYETLSTQSQINNLCSIHAVLGSLIQCDEKWELKVFLLRLYKYFHYFLPREMNWNIIARAMYQVLSCNVGKKTLLYSSPIFAYLTFPRILLWLTMVSESILSMLWTGNCLNISLLVLLSKVFLH